MDGKQDGLFVKRGGPIFTVAQTGDGKWALYFCSEAGEPHRHPIAWVEQSPDGWEIALREGRRWIPVPETLDMLRRNGLLEK